MTNSEAPPSTTAARPVADVTATYFDAWRTKDLDRLRSVLADDVSFDGPMATLTGADACVDGIRGLSQITTDVVISKVFVDGTDVLTWFELHSTIAAPIPVANWSHVEDGRITAVRVVFDPRTLVPPDAA